MLSYMCGTLAQHPDYLGLWRNFTGAVFTLRVAPYFTTVPWPAGPSSGASVAFAKPPVVLSDETLVSLIVASVQALQQQYDTFSPTKTTEACMWREVGDVVALFRLIYRYILVYGEAIESVLLEDLDDVCAGFKKTKCGEVSVLMFSTSRKLAIYNIVYCNC